MQHRGQSAAFAFLVGLILGVVGTFGHRDAATVAGVSLHWGIVVALLGVACFLVGLRLYTDGRLIPVAGAIGLLVPIAVFSIQGPGGSVVIVNDVLGKLWDFGPALIAVGVLAWPKLPSRAA